MSLRAKEHNGKSCTFSNTFKIQKKILRVSHSWHKTLTCTVITLSLSRTIFYYVINLFSDVIDISTLLEVSLTRCFLLKLHIEYHVTYYEGGKTSEWVINRNSNVIWFFVGFRHAIKTHILFQISIGKILWIIPIFQLENAPKSFLIKSANVPIDLNRLKELSRRFNISISERSEF